MSLINDALKKAQQRQQEGPSPTPQGTAPVVPKVAAAPSVPVKAIGLVFAVSFLFLLLIGLGSWQVWRMMSVNRGEVAAAQTNETVAVERQSSESVREALATPQPESGPAITPAVEVSSPRTDARATRDPGVESYLQSASISAREAGENSRVIINGRFYSLGEEVHFGDSLRIVEVSGGTVVFRDHGGTEYRHRL